MKKNISITSPISFFFFLFSFFLFLVTPSVAGEMKPPDRLPDLWKLTGDAEGYSGQNLYGHINGGAEIFLEFGFTELTVYRYAAGEKRLILEIYEMSDPEAALGIYLHRTAKESAHERVHCRNTANRYQISAVTGPYYIQVLNPSGIMEHTTLMADLLNALCKEVDAGSSPDTFSLLPKDGRIEGSEGLFRGEYALQPLFTFGRGDIFLLQGKRTGFYADYTDKAYGTYTQIMIPYSEPEMALRALQHVKENLDSYLKVLRTTRQELIFKDYNQEFGRAEVRDNILHVQIHLKTLPEKPGN